MIFPLRWSKILAKIPSEVIEVLTSLARHGYQGFLVGGACRNLFLGKEIQDWDIATDALPEASEALFPKTIPLGKKFGTILVLKNDLPIEVTTFRQEASYSDYRHPDKVEFIKDITRDLGRRDFTINAMALAPHKKVFLDPFGGRRDLRRKIVRAIGSPHERFQEDPLRMLRFFRFQASLGFRGDEKTAQALDAQALMTLSKERIAQELNRILLAPYPLAALENLLTSGLLEKTLPELQILNKEKEILAHSLKVVEAIKPELHLRWAALLHDLAKPLTARQVGSRLHFFNHEEIAAQLAKKIMEELKLPKKLQETTSHLILWHMFPADPHFSDQALRRLIRKVGPEHILDLLELRRADIVGSSQRFDLAWPSFSLFHQRIQGLLAEKNIFSLQDLALSGHEVMAILNIPPGPQVGYLLEKLFMWVSEEPERNSKEKLEKYLKTIALNNS